MIRYEINDARFYFYMYLVSRDLTHLETAFKYHRAFTFFLCVEFALLIEYSQVSNKGTWETTRYKDLKLVA